MKKISGDSLFAFMLLMTCLLVLPIPSSALTGCEKAQELFEKSLDEKDTDISLRLLKDAVKLCPDHAAAWNNLGMLYEEKRELDEAGKAYKKANRIRPDLGAPLAGLGDITMTQGLFEEASKYYRQFLDILSDGLRNGDPQGLGPYEEEYRGKYKQARLRLGIQEDSASKVVTRGVLTRGFRSIKVKKKLLKPTGPERLALCILFDFDSANLKPKGREQLIEMAETMLSDELRSSRFTIEGHTDLFGTPHYNLELSRKRAEKVCTFLVSYGVGPERLETRACGESRPIVCYGGREKQATNRRVEFIRK